MSNPQILNPCPVLVCKGGHEATDAIHRCDICLFGPAIALRPFTGSMPDSARQMICFGCRERFARLGIQPVHPHRDGWRYTTDERIAEAQTIGRAKGWRA